MGLILFLVFGLIVGALARFVVPGREAGGWGLSMILGVVGSLLGAMLGRLFGIYREGEMTGGFIMSLIGAIILVAGYHALARRRVVV